MKKKGFAEAAVLCALAVLLAASAMGGGGQKVAVIPANEGEQGAGAAEAASEGTESSPSGAETTLSLMAEVNAAEPVLSPDSYRTWYEVFVYSFFDGDGDGVGDLPGLRSKLDYIGDGDPSTDGDLGCDGIWLMPIMPSTTYHKYDVTDYCAIDPEYGTMEDFDALIEDCHARGIRVIIDLVMNHTSSQHEWFKAAAEYLSGLPEGAEPDATECPYVDYYHFSRERQGGYVELPGTQWNYEAQFWSEMPDLNLESAAVREEFSRIVDFWLSHGVDGFRLDAAKEYDTGDDAANIEILSWFNDMVKGKSEDAYIVAEVWSGLEQYAAYYESGIDSCFDFAFADQDGVIARAAGGKSESGAAGYGSAIMSLQEALAEHGESCIDAPFYTNHDMGRGAGYYAGDYSENQTKIAQAMNLLMTGSSFLYYGEELGMKGSGKDENKRAPMYWSDDPGAKGLCAGPPEMDDVSMKYGSYEEQLGDGDSIYQFVKQAIRVRESHPAIMRGTATWEEGLSDKDVCVIKKEYEGEEALLVFNIGEGARDVDVSGIALSGKEPGDLSLSGLLLTSAEAASLSGGSLSLPGYSVAVLE